MKILCDNPDYPEEKGKSEIKEPESWPICKQLPCSCLGYSMNADESLSVLETSCPPEENIVQYTNVAGINYTVPRRENCGTYKPQNPNSTNTCYCEDLDPRKLNKRFQITVAFETHFGLFNL